MLSNTTLLLPPLRIGGSHVIAGIFTSIFTSIPSLLHSLSYVPRYTVCAIKLFFFCDSITGIRNSLLPVWYQQRMWENSSRCVEKCFEKLTVALRCLCWNQISAHLVSGCAFPWLITPGGMSLNPPATRHYHTVAPGWRLAGASTGTNVYYNDNLIFFFFKHYVDNVISFWTF